MILKDLLCEIEIASTKTFQQNFRMVNCINYRRGPFFKEANLLLYFSNNVVCCFSPFHSNLNKNIFFINWVVRKTMNRLEACVLIWYIKQVFLLNPFIDIFKLKELAFNLFKWIFRDRADFSPWSSLKKGFL